ncbi:MAG: triose-phosphate isomerase [Candidatus Micrarchaeia archaeon]
MRYLALNFKAFAESSGANGLRLCRAASEAASAFHGVEVIVAPQASDLHWLASQELPFIKIFAQHCDSNQPGAFTGSTTARALKDAGCHGTLLNHAEKKVSLQQAGQAISNCSLLGLRVLACAKDVEEGVALARLSPWGVAVEPPELIGGGVSVSSAKPEVVEEAVACIKQANPSVVVLVGAGVSNAADARKCVELGAQGVLLASAFVKAREPREWVEQVLRALE